MQTLENSLKQHKLRITPVRLELLQYFHTSKKALSHADLENKFVQKFDRVTIYRTLSSFVENGLLHKILDDSGTAKYALCMHNNIDHHHTDNHVHFKCTSCDKIECLHDIEIPVLKLPKKYKMQNANLLLEGTCANCNH